MATSSIDRADGGVINWRDLNDPSPLMLTGSGRSETRLHRTLCHLLFGAATLTRQRSHDDGLKALLLALSHCRLIQLLRLFTLFTQETETCRPAHPTRIENRQQKSVNKSPSCSFSLISIPIKNPSSPLHSAYPDF